MRSGAPDSQDLMVAFNCADLAIDLIHDGRNGLMTALRNGCYNAVDISVVAGGAKRVDVEALYDAAGYRADIQSVSGKPIFLN